MVHLFTRDQRVAKRILPAHCRAAKAVLAAEAAQQKALAAARLAFREAEATGQSLAASKAQDWLGAAEYAVEVS